MTSPAAPSELAYLTRLIGDAATLALIETHGGTRLYIPRRPAELARLIGEQEAAQLAAEFGGSYLKVPTAKFWRARVLRASGHSYAQIARALGATESSVWRWLNAAGQTERQLSLW